MSSTDSLSFVEEWKALKQVGEQLISEMGRPCMLILTLSHSLCDL